jgi:hypothetical protein
LTKSKLIPVFADVFGRVQREVRMAGRDFAAAKAQLAEEGWCVIPEVLSPAQTGRALDRLWATVEANDRTGATPVIPGLDPNAQNVRVYNLIQSDAVFRELIQHETALEFVREVLGPDFLISNFTANIARPGARSMAMHSDQSLVAPEPWLAPWSVNIIWCLSDASFENGATMFVPGSQNWHSHAQVPADAPSRLRAFEAKAGSIVVMEGRVWHTSGANITASDDRALAFGYYSKAFLRPQTNWNVTLPAELQAQLSPDMRHWLALEATANRALATHLNLRPAPPQGQ